ncbi:conserved hypothetical protein [Agrobacterium deltaense Zutra 3/1]|uniref:Uncharacterized protein n=1 Tax=Agrobacterium deltaense Zutra 3/1 TaxID=1183427 RepID=A0A1S7R2V9_9HYPH|nr:pentapeptide repeat-containing protein [Agrobacterium deltaense]CUX45895.1 conserved hypothetical protein [Agrobacterium deltaense Zutra 3/1]
MRDSGIFTLDLSLEEQERLRTLIETQSNDFIELINAGGFDPLSDFRFIDLSKVDFGSADLRGFDFTGTDLRGCIGRPIWDETTILTDADVEGSVFDERGVSHGASLPESFVKQHWPDLIMWMDRFKFGPERYREDAEKLLFVFMRSEDSLVRRTALRYLADYLEPDVIMDLIRELVFERGEKNLVVPAFDLLGDYYEQKPEAVRKFVVSLLNSIWAAEAAEFLIKRSKSNKKAQRSLVEFMSRHPAPATRRRFIGSLASEMGVATAFVVRDPLTGDVFDFGASISSNTIDLITRAIRRIRRDEAEGNAPLVLTQAFSANTVTGIRSQVINRLVEITLMGTKYNVPIFGYMTTIEEPDKVSAMVMTFDE